MMKYILTLILLSAITLSVWADDKNTRKIGNEGIEIARVVLKAATRNPEIMQELKGADTIITSISVEEKNKNTSAEVNTYTLDGVIRSSDIPEGKFTLTIRNYLVPGNFGYVDEYNVSLKSEKY